MVLYMQEADPFTNAVELSLRVASNQTFYYWNNTREIKDAVHVKTREMSKNTQNQVKVLI